MWWRPGAELLYGFQHEISKEEFARRIADNTLLDVVRHVPVQKGDVFFIPAGALHAIGKGILICEVQQNSNTTYRIYDYGRVGADGKPRDLHIEKALDVTTLAPAPAHACGNEVDLFAGARARLLAACDYFTAYHLTVDGECALTVSEDSFQCLTVDGGCEFTVGEDSFVFLTALSGSMKLRSETDELSIEKGESVFLPANLGRCVLTGAGELILSKI